MVSLTTTPWFVPTTLGRVPVKVIQEVRWCFPVDRRPMFKWGLYHGVRVLVRSTICPAFSCESAHTSIGLKPKCVVSRETVPNLIQHPTLRPVPHHFLLHQSLRPALHHFLHQTLLPIPQLLLRQVRHPTPRRCLLLLRHLAPHRTLRPAQPHLRQLQVQLLHQPQDRRRTQRHCQLQVPHYRMPLPSQLLIQYQTQHHNQQRVRLQHLPQFHLVLAFVPTETPPSLSNG
mmetsp:Transcript_3158/g.5333  ORF Transcript_3158/g.5333 Transcript_3158/m.5333 type:complete len:230 (+) Transcript_3158:277-966(+)